MKRVAWLVVLLASAPVLAQEGDSNALPRVVVLPTSGNCGKPVKQSLQAAGENAASSLDPTRYQFTDMNAVGAQMMAMGEDETACKTDKCWLDLMARLDVSFVMRAECMDVAGTSYVTLRFFNGKSGAVMAQGDFQGTASVATAEVHQRALVAEALKLDLAAQAPQAGSQDEEKPAVASGPKVAVFLCEMPFGTNHAPDYAGVTNTSKAVGRWLAANKMSMAPIPQGFRVPPSSLGKDCNLDSTRARDLALKVGAKTLVWLVAKDHEVITVKPGGVEVRAFHTRLNGRAYNVDIGRYGRGVGADAGACDEPTLAKEACLQAYEKVGVAGFMTDWAASLKVNPADF
jgi:hypothetical protein